MERKRMKSTSQSNTRKVTEVIILRELVVIATVGPGSLSGEVWTELMRTPESENIRPADFIVWGWNDHKFAYWTTSDKQSDVAKKMHIIQNFSKRPISRPEARYNQETKEFI